MLNEEWRKSLMLNGEFTPSRMFFVFRHLHFSSSIPHSSFR
jgi:hypothetical protein